MPPLFLPRALHNPRLPLSPPLPRPSWCSPLPKVSLGSDLLTARAGGVEGGRAGLTVGLLCAQTPPQGKHRYVLLLYKQSGRISEDPPAHRNNWDLKAFVANNKLGTAVNVVYYYAQPE